MIVPPDGEGEVVPGPDDGVLGLLVSEALHILAIDRHQEVPGQQSGSLGEGGDVDLAGQLGNYIVKSYVREVM